MTTADTTPAPAPIRWGILATGWIARTMTQDLVDHGHTVTAVGSRTLERAEEFARDFSIPNVYGSYEALVADPEVDVIYVATPHSEHEAHALLAINAGKHVLVEKAFTRNESEARRVLEAANERGVVVLEAMWTRFLPHMAHLRELLSRGAIGRIRHVHSTFPQLIEQGDEGRLRNPHLAGGALLDLGVYPIAFLHDVIGAPESIHAHAVLTTTGVDESVATVSTHADGVLATTYSSQDVGDSVDTLILGDTGRIEIGPWWFCPSTVTVRDSDGNVVEVYDERPTGRGMQFQAAEIERLIREGETESPLMTHADTLAVMQTLDEIRAQIGVRFPGE